MSGTWLCTAAFNKHGVRLMTIVTTQNKIPLKIDKEFSYWNSRLTKSPIFTIFRHVLSVKQKRNILILLFNERSQYKPMHVRKLKPNQQIRSVYVYYEYDNWSRYGINKKNTCKKMNSRHYIWNIQKPGLFKYCPMIKICA